MSMEDPADAFLAGIADGRLLFLHCPQCGANLPPDRGLCPECWSPALQWHEAGGGGSIRSFVVFHRAFAAGATVPYNVVQVELDEGPRIVATLTGGEPAVDARVRARFEHGESGLRLVFEPERKGA